MWIMDNPDYIILRIILGIKSGDWWAWIGGTWAVARVAGGANHRIRARGRRLARRHVRAADASTDAAVADAGDDGHEPSSSCPLHGPSEVWGGIADCAFEVGVRAAAQGRTAHARWATGTGSIIVYYSGASSWIMDNLDYIILCINTYYRLSIPGRRTRH